FLLWSGPAFATGRVKSESVQAALVALVAEPAVGRAEFVTMTLNVGHRPVEPVARHCGLGNTNVGVATVAVGTKVTGARFAALGWGEGYGSVPPSGLVTGTASIAVSPTYSVLPCGPVRKGVPTVGFVFVTVIVTGVAVVFERPKLSVTVRLNLYVSGYVKSGS